MPAQSRRGQGQWAYGHHEPLNAAERFKKDDDGLNVRARIILGCPVAGLDAPETLAASPMLRAAEEVATPHPGFTNLPRKYKTTVTGCASLCTAHEINDISFVGVTGPGGTPGFDLWVGGGLSTNPMLAQRLGVFVEPGQVPDVWARVTGIFRDYRYPRPRNPARPQGPVAP